MIRVEKDRRSNDVPGEATTASGNPDRTGLLDSCRRVGDLCIRFEKSLPVEKESLLGNI